MKDKFQPGDLVDIISDNTYVGTGLVLGFHEECDEWNKLILNAYKIFHNGKTSFYFAGELRRVE
jgi:hypothetical protein